MANSATRQFVKEHIGCQVEYHNGDARSTFIEGRLLGEVIGWYESQHVVILPPEDEKALVGLSRYTEQSFKRYSNNGSTKTDYGKNYKFGVYFLVPRLLRPVIAPPANFTLYPNTCKSCGCKVRKTDEFTLCSNTKCKTRLQVMKAMGFNKVKPLGRLDDDGFLVCEICRNQIHDWSLPLYNTEGMRELTCRSGHKAVYTFQKGDKVYYMGAVYLWDGNGANMQMERRKYE